MLARSLRTTMGSIRLELLLASVATSGTIALFDSLIDLRTRVAFVVVFAFTVWFATAGGVAGLMTFDEVASGVRTFRKPPTMMFSSVISPFPTAS